MISISSPLAHSISAAHALRLLKGDPGVFQQPVRFILSISLAFSLIACKDREERKLAVVGGSTITARDVDAALSRPLSQLNQQIYTLRRQKLDELIEERLLREEAERRGVSVETLLEQEVNSKILQVSDDEITALYKANKARIPVELDKVREKIRDFLRRQRMSAQRTLFLQSLRAKAKIVTYLKAPDVFRAEVSIDDAPVRGDKTAPVTVVKFEDFQCPFCKQVQPTFDQLLAKYDGKVRLVHKDMPLDSLHPQARLAAEAAHCAGDQGKFWQYHDALYANAPKAALDDLKKYAKAVGLEAGAFESCVKSGKYRSKVQQDIEEGTKLGVTGTPTFFINGREISGSHPIATFVNIIDEELAQKKNGTSKSASD